MEDRIEINGVWYVRETTKSDNGNTPQEVETPKDYLRRGLLGGFYNMDEVEIFCEPYESEEVLIENTQYCIEYSYMLGNYSSEDHISITIMFKGTKGINTRWHEEYIDSSDWIKSILQGDSNGWDDLIDLFHNDDKGVAFFFYGLKHIEKLGWFSR
jgi:hypothetical protein